MAYYRNCATEEDPLPCDVELLLHISSESEEVGTAEFHESRVRWDNVLTKCKCCQIFCNLNIHLVCVSNRHFLFNMHKSLKHQIFSDMHCKYHRKPMPITRNSSIFHSTISWHDEVKNLPSLQKKSTELWWMKVSAPVDCSYSFCEDLFIGFSWKSWP